MRFLTKLQGLLHEHVIRVLLFVVVGVYLFNLFPYVTFGVFARDLLVRGIVAFVVVSLALKREWLTAHIVIFLSGFTGAGAAFINAIFSYSFATNSFSWTFSLSWLLNAFAFVYLVVYFLTLVLERPSHAYAYEDHPLWRYLAFMFVFYLFRNSFNTAFFVMMPIVLVGLRRYWLYAGVLALGTLSTFPLNFIIDAFNRNLSWRLVSYYLYLLLALVLLFFIGKVLWQQYFAKSVSAEDSDKPSSPAQEPVSDTHEEASVVTEDEPMDEIEKEKKDDQ